ncbi:hypothetical protein CGLO_01758 [Colletotrichum gloeosporioides Cg-14]|uniref:Uncharacterized protein n=1 Tax=Colletotrichum gloeosporioides (strain Cg-14) TaxID=1237896 RepID=T0L0S5_COLGC|nr:hypothetical protein CGLO_01758 [Colletotrichum gloeosporioides Cg-14]
MKTAFATTIFAFTRLATATCHGNNCARAVTGFGPHVKPEVSIRKGDCSDFMRATVSPDPSTTTITKTSPTTVTKYTTNGQAEKRFAVAEPLVNPIAPRAPVTIFPSVLPYYATKVCAGTSEYSSVCNCWAITPTVTTLEPAIVPTTTTTTATVTVDVTCEMAAICPFNKVNTFPCKKGQKKGPRCACLKGAVNKDPNICVQNLDCKKAKTCKSSDNCEPDEGCVQHHCCGNKKTKICLKYAPGSC